MGHFVGRRSPHPVMLTCACCGQSSVGSRAVSLRRVTTDPARSSMLTAVLAVVAGCGLMGAILALIAGVWLLAVLGILVMVSGGLLLWLRLRAKGTVAGRRT